MFQQDLRKVPIRSSLLCSQTYLGSLQENLVTDVPDTAEDHSQGHACKEITATQGHTTLKWAPCC